MSHRHTHFLGYKNMLEMHIAEKVSFLQNILLVHVKSVSGNAVSFFTKL